MNQARTVRYTLFVLLCLFVAAPASVWAQPAAGARVTALTGSLNVVRMRQTPRALGLNDPVLNGDELITGENSYATIHTTSGATVEIFPDSRLVFSERSADIQEFLRLFFGSIKVYIEKITGRPNPHKMTTPTAVIAVRGTIFSVFVDENDSTLVAVEEGVVGVTNVRYPDQEVILQRGQRTWVHEGQPPQQAQAFRGRSERADLAPPRMGVMGSDAAAGAMQGSMEQMDQRMENMSGSRGMGGMGSNSKHPGMRQ